MNENNFDINYKIPEERKDNVEVNEAALYNLNKTKNKEKLLFFNFLVFNTKIDVHLEELQGYLFWGGIIEYFCWLVLLALFISYPSQMGLVWIFFYHNARATIGLFILKHIPKTHDVIENLRDYENCSLEDIQKHMEHNYISIIHENERVLKPLLITYLVLTFVSIFIDFILFCVVASDMHHPEGKSEKKFICLLAVIAFIICDLSYFSLLTSLRFSFPPETISAITKAIFGFFNQLKVGISSGFQGMVRKFKRRAVEEVVSNQIN